MDWNTLFSEIISRIDKSEYRTDGIPQSLYLKLSCKLRVYVTSGTVWFDTGVNRWVELVPPTDELRDALATLMREHRKVFSPSDAEVRKRLHKDLFHSLPC